MIIRDKDNFLPLIAKMLTALNYDKVEMHTGKPYDITAGKKEKNFFIFAAALVQPPPPDRLAGHHRLHEPRALGR